MDRCKQLLVLHHTCGGDACKVAFRHIFNTQGPLLPEDHAYLDEHSKALTWEVHAWHLAYGPPNVQQIIDRLVDGFPPAEPGLERVLFFDNVIAQHAHRYPPGVVDQLANRLRPPRLHVESWWQIARQIEEVCAPYRALQKANASDLGLLLFEHRRQEPAFQGALAAILRARHDMVGALLLGEARVAGLLPLLRPREVLPGVLRFKGEPDASDADWQYRCIALEWPGDGAAEAQAWYLDQVADAAGRGVKPHILWLSTPPLLRTEAAFRAQDAGTLVPWLNVSLGDALERREPGAWNRLFRYLDTPGALEPPEAAMPYVHPEREPAEGAPKAEPGPRLDVRAARYPEEFAASLLVGAPLPEDADEAFKARLLRYRDLIKRHTILGTPEDHVFRRFAALPLTKERANGLLREGFRGNKPILETARLIDIAMAADPLPEEELPPVEDIVRHPLDAERVAFYRVLAGLYARDRLGAWMRAALTPAVDEPRDSWKSDPFKLARQRAKAAPDLVPDDVKRWLIEEARKQTVGWMLDFLADRTLPWLMDEATLAAAALERAETERDVWAYRDTSRLPAVLLPAVRIRVRSGAPGEDEEVSLLGWLEQHGEAPGDLVAAMLAHLGGRKPGHAERAWLAEKLSSGSRWDRHGRDVFLALIHAEAWEETGLLVRRVLATHASVADEKQKKKRHGLVVALHDAMGRALVHVAERALARGVVEEALGALHGLAALRPHSGRLRGLVHRLGQRPDLPADVEQMIALNEELLRRDTTGEATELDLTTALSLLAEKRAAPAASLAMH